MLPKLNFQEISVQSVVWGFPLKKSTKPTYRNGLFHITAPLNRHGHYHVNNKQRNLKIERKKP